VSRSWPSPLVVEGLLGEAHLPGEFAEARRSAILVTIGEQQEADGETHGIAVGELDVRILEAVAGGDAGLRLLQRGFDLMGRQEAFLDEKAIEGGTGHEQAFELEIGGIHGQPAGEWIMTGTDRGAGGSSAMSEMPARGFSPALRFPWQDETEIAELESLRHTIPLEPDGHERGGGANGAARED